MPGIYREGSPDELSLERAWGPNERLFCSFCGQQCVYLGHMMGRFLLCPTHGEFTIAPLVVRDVSRDPETFGITEDRGWVIKFRDHQERAMWETCRAVEGQHE